MVATLSESEPSWEHARTWDELVEIVSQVEILASEAGEPAARDVCRLLRERLHELKETSAEPGHLHRALLRYASRLIRAYLEGANRADVIDVLVTVLQHPAWVNPLKDKQAKTLRKLLNTPASLHGFSEEQTTASAGDAHALGLSERAGNALESVPADARSADTEDDGPVEERTDAARESDASIPAQATDRSLVAQRATAADAAEEPAAATDGAAEISPPDEMDVVPGSVDDTTEPESSLDETSNAPRDEDEDAAADAAWTDYTIEPDDPLDQTLSALPGDDAEADAVDDTIEPDNSFDQTLNVLPGDEADTNAISVDYIVEPEEETLDAVPGDQAEIGTGSVDDTAEPPGPPEPTFGTDPNEIVETTDDDVSGDDDDVTTELIRELRRESRTAAEHAHGAPRGNAGRSQDSAASPADETARTAHSTEPDAAEESNAADTLEALTQEFGDPEEAEADLQALYSADAPMEELADTDDRSAADAAPTVEAEPEPSDPSDRPADAAPEGLAAGGREHQTHEGWNAPAQGSAMDTLDRALGGLAEEYGEIDGTATSSSPLPIADDPSDETEPSDALPGDTGRQGENLVNGEDWFAALREMTQIVVANISELHTSIVECVRLTARGDIPSDERRAAITHACQQLERFGGTVEAIGSPRLTRFYERIRENLSALERQLRQ